MVGHYPWAEPVVLVDRDLAHLYPAVRLLDLVRAPVTPKEAPRLADALPLFAIDWHEILALGLHEAVRPAVVVRGRTGWGRSVRPSHRLAVSRDGPHLWH